MKEKVVFITGAKGGLGSFITRRFLETGTTVLPNPGVCARHLRIAARRVTKNAAKLKAASGGGQCCALRTTA